jgi:hypothetical protein
MKTVKRPLTDLSFTEAYMLSEAEWQEWKRLRLAELLQPYRGADRIRRKLWARRIIRDYDRRRQVAAAATVD